MPLSVAEWDRFDSYLFDIDGTLLECRDAVHYFAFLECLRNISGKELTLEGVPVHGSTDPKILADALQLAGVPEESWRPLIAAGLKGMAQQVEKNRARIEAHVLPGVQQVLEHVRRRGAVLGVATGNLEVIAWLKLEACGLRGFFSFGGFSDGCECRADTFRLASTRAKKIAGNHANVCVIGDTPADILAARENGLDVIAVSTGIFSYEELLSHSPDLCVRSLRELLRDFDQPGSS